MLRILLILIVIVGLLGDEGNPGGNDSCDFGTAGDTTQDQQELRQGINQFSFEFFKQVTAANPGENTIMSPISVTVPFDQLMLYAKNETQKQLLSTLRVRSIDQLRRAIKPVLESIRGSDGVTLAQANKVYINDMYTLSKGFASDTSCLFNASAESIDCTQPEATAARINKYVADNTNNKITNLIPADVIDETVRIMLVNAMYFKGTWQIQFDKNKTQPRDFYTSDNKTIQVPTMYMESRLNYTYSSAMKSKIVVLYYTNTNFKFVIVLPDARNGLTDVVNKLDAETMNEILSNVHETRVKLWLPSFKSRLALNLNNILISMGLRDIFDQSRAQLSGLLAQDQPLWVSSGIHQAYIEVNEEGTEAAAATAIVVGVTSVGAPKPPVPEVRCEHPFLMQLYAGSTLIFTGSLQQEPRD